MQQSPSPAPALVASFKRALVICSANTFEAEHNALKTLIDVASAQDSAAAAWTDALAILLRSTNEPALLAGLGASSCALFSPVQGAPTHMGLILELATSAAPPGAASSPHASPLPVRARLAALQALEECSLLTFRNCPHEWLSTLEKVTGTLEDRSSLLSRADVGSGTADGPSWASPTASASSTASSFAAGALEWQAFEGTLLAVRSCLRGAYLFDGSDSDSARVEASNVALHTVRRAMEAAAAALLSSKNHYVREAALHVAEAAMRWLLRFYPGLSDTSDNEGGGSETEGALTTGIGAADVAASPSAANNNVTGENNVRTAPAATGAQARELLALCVDKLCLPGTQDSHPQARFAAGSAVLVVLQGARRAITDSKRLRAFLPALCFNRYCGSERQRHFHQNVWKELVMGEALQLAASAAPAVVGAAAPALATAAGSPFAMTTPMTRGHSPPRVGASIAAAGSNSSSNTSRERAASPLRASSLAAAVSATIGNEGSSPGRPFPPPPPSASAAAAAAFPAQQHPAIAGPSSVTLPAAVSAGSAAGPLLVARYIDDVAAFYCSQMAVVSVSTDGSTTANSGDAGRDVDVDGEEGARAGGVLDKPLPLTEDVKALHLDIDSTGAGAGVADGISRSRGFAPLHPEIVEAACNCAAELAIKIPSDAVTPHVEMISRSLMRVARLADDWRPRDVAVIALGRFYNRYPHCFTCPASTSSSLADDVFACWLERSFDVCRPVRDHAAAVLGESWGIAASIAISISAEPGHSYEKQAMAEARRRLDALEGKISISPSSVSSASVSPYTCADNDIQGVDGVVLLLRELSSTTSSTNSSTTGAAKASMASLTPPRAVPSSDAAPSPSLMAASSGGAAAAIPKGLFTRSSASSPSNGHGSVAGSNGSAVGSEAAAFVDETLPRVLALLRSHSTSSINNASSSSVASAGAGSSAVVDLSSSAAATLHFVQESGCRALCELFQRAGKVTAKRHLDDVIPLCCDFLSTAGTAESRARAWAAGDLAAGLRKAVGPSIFRGRLNQEQAAVLASSPAMPKEFSGQ